MIAASLQVNVAFKARQDHFRETLTQSTACKRHSFHSSRYQSASIVCIHLLMVKKRGNKPQETHGQKQKSDGRQAREDDHTQTQDLTTKTLN